MSLECHRQRLQSREHTVLVYLFHRHGKDHFVGPPLGTFSKRPYWPVAERGLVKSPKSLKSLRNTTSYLLQHWKIFLSSKIFVPTRVQAHACGGCVLYGVLSGTKHYARTSASLGRPLSRILRILQNISESESEIFWKLLLNPRKQQRISNSPTLPRSTQLRQFWYWNKLNYYFLKNWVFSRTLWQMTKCIIIISFCSNYVSFKHSCIAQFKHFLSLKKYENNLHLFIDVWKPQMLILLWIPFF